MTDLPCPTENELSRALDAAGPHASDARVSGHVATCATCRATQDVLRRAVVAARALPSNVPDEARRNEVRAHLLAKAALAPVGRTRRGSFRLALGLAAVGAAAMLALSLGRRPAPEAARSHIAVRPGPGARYEISSPPPWETIRLTEGEIDLDVEPLGPRERVRVEVGDGEVEVRGTRFQVTARADRLVGVAVTHGRVAVRPRGGEPIVLGAGQRWRAPPDANTLAPPVAAVEPGVAPVVPPAPHEATNIHARPRRASSRTDTGVERALRPTLQEALYDDAWDALRAHRFEDAARGFARVLAEAPSGPLADEAAFWRPTSLARGGQPGKAISAFKEFLARYRGSPRRGEASAILGWLLVDAHRADEAEPLFRVAGSDAQASVRESAREGLAAVAHAPAGR